MSDMKSILENIKDAVYVIEWTSETKKQKALDLCISIYNLYVYNGGDFNTYRSLSREYFYSVIGKKYAYEIKDCLIDKGILIINNSYNVNKGKGKGYKFNGELISGEYVSTNVSTKSDVSTNVSTNYINFGNLSISNNFSIFYNSNTITLSYLCPPVETYINKGLERLTFKPEINNYIKNFIVKRDDIKVDNEITDEYVNVKFENDDFRYELNKALKLANEMNVNLIQYKEKCYIENLDDFIIRKTNDLRLIYRKNIFDIENKIFRISRNETNRRLDYNLTNMKSDLLDFLLIDGEELIELDIANAQFSILSFITDCLDDDFINKSQNGILYNNDKKEWFRIAFDKIKENKLQDTYPKTIKWINEYKNQFGYKSFSIMLQNVESIIMIDNLLPRLIDKGFDVFTIHDAVRVRKSHLDAVKSEIKEYFNEINFKCLIRNKKDDFDWSEWQPKKIIIEKSAEDFDYGDGDGIEGFIESIDL